MSKIALGDARSLNKKELTMKPAGSKAATAMLKRSDNIAASRQLKQKSLLRPSL